MLWWRLLQCCCIIPRLDWLTKPDIHTAHPLVLAFNFSSLPPPTLKKRKKTENKKHPILSLTENSSLDKHGSEVIHEGKDSWLESAHLTVWPLGKVITAAHSLSHSQSFCKAKGSAGTTTLTSTSTSNLANTTKQTRPAPVVRPCIVGSPNDIADDVLAPKEQEPANDRLFMCDRCMVTLDTCCLLQFCL